MTIRRGGSPRDPGGLPEDQRPGPAEAGATPEPAPPQSAEPGVPDFLRAGGSVREGGSLRGGTLPPSAGATPSPAGGALPPAAASDQQAVEVPRSPAPMRPRTSNLPPPPPRPPRTASGAGPWPRSLMSAISPLLSLLGLALVGVLSLALVTGQLPSVIAGGGGGGNQGGAVKTPTPSNIVIVDPRANVPGTLVYAKDGNLWLQSGASVRQLTASGRDSMPTWSADGQWIYFIRTTPTVGRWPVNGIAATYILSIPALVRIHPDGTGIQTLLNGRVKQGSNLWQSFIRQPFPSPDGNRVVVVTDHPNPTTSDVVLKILNLKSGALVNPNLPENTPLGHQDPAWSPDGGSIAYVMDARSGTRGTPVIERYDLSTGKTRAVSGPGYLGPAWSPDGRYLAATKTGSFGTDIVILDARTGAELLRVTNDQSSFDPVWSPAGNAISFLRVDHGVVDLELVTLNGSGPNWTVGDTIALTESAGLDAASRPSWFIPASQLPTPGPSLAPTAIPFPTLHGPSQAPSPSQP